MKKLILGVATNSGGRYKTGSNGKMTKSYVAWYNMLLRAYCPKYHVRRPTYISCLVAEEWLEYQDFAEWFENHEYSNHGYQLDKDLLIPGNKLYTPDRCVFVPQQLNKLLTDSGAARGQYKQGVRFHKGANKFRADVAISGKQKHLGYYDNELEAYNAYKKAKEQYVKDMANLWKNDIADDVYQALMRWELEGE